MARSGGGRRARAVALSLAALAVAAAGLFAFGRLRALWLEQCVITDVGSQVSVTDGRMARAEVVASAFGLRNGANLALIDFEGKRREILARIPNIREITVSRHLPDRVDIVVEERIPVVRLALRGQSKQAESGRVADTDGVVFLSSRGTQMLPVIREGSAPGAKSGDVLAGHALAALRLLEACRDGFRELNVVDVDVSKQDYLQLVLANDYSIAKFAWKGMENPDASKPALLTQLKHLSDAYCAQVDDSIRIWNATQPGKVYGDTQREGL